MTPIPLVLALALAGLADDNPADLAARVGSAEPGAREEAEGRLEEIGRPALPALRIALDRAEDPATARRIADLVDLIERKRLLRATPVVLDDRDAPVGEAVADLARRSGLRLALDPPDQPAWASTRVTVATGGPVGFWEALDRLGAAGGFRVETGSYWTGAPADAPAVRLVRDAASPVGASYAGPYRVDLLSLERHRRVTQPKPGRPAKAADDFAASLRLVAEPGVHVDRNGPPRVLEAVDGRGVDLRPSSTRDPTAPAGMISFRQWQPTLGVLTYRVPLALPDGGGGVLKRFKGVLPIAALARTGPLLTAPMAGIEGRPLSGSGVSLLIRQVGRPSERAWTLQGVVRGEPHRAAPPTAAGPRQLTLASLRPSFQPDDHLQVVDDRGRPFLLSTNANTPRPDGSIEFTATVHTNPQYGPPTTLRYYGLVAEATEVPFRFEGVPMP